MTDEKNPKAAGTADKAKEKALPSKRGAGEQPAGSGKGSQKTQQRARTSVDQVSVSDGALAKIVGLSAHEVPGIVGMAPASFSEGIRRILGARQVDEGVVLARSEDGKAADVDMHVVVAYGVNIPVVAESVRERVRYAAKLYAGIELKKIRVHVAGVSRA
ncbi:MAG TPA: Asp23/Gls24 family envelope stress response protein [Trueperaceae bacterium]|nr:Asp23/Gls24 family envelope stress response protein [Trueperaceae bacterium]